MKKGTILIISIITLILTFVIAEIFSIYHFGSVPTLLTSLYLISIFAMLEYLAISITYIVRRLIKKEKLKIKNIIGLILLFVALLLVLLYLVVLDQTTPNMIQGLKGIFARKPLISKGI